MPPGACTPIAIATPLTLLHAIKLARHDTFLIIVVGLTSGSPNHCGSIVESLELRNGKSAPLEVNELTFKG